MIEKVKRYVTKDLKEHKSKKEAEDHIIDVIGANFGQRFNNIKEPDLYLRHKQQYALLMELIGDMDKLKKTIEIFDIAL